MKIKKIVFLAAIGMLLSGCNPGNGGTGGGPTPNPTVTFVHSTPTPIATPTPVPTDTPTPLPTDSPTPVPTDTPTAIPTDTPTATPTDTPTPVPTDTPTATPTDTPSPLPTDSPTPVPTDTPTPLPTDTPTPIPTDTPTPIPTDTPTVTPTDSPPPTPSPTPFVNPIKHVIIIVQENRSMDNLYNGYPGADTVSSWKGTTLATNSLAAHVGPGHGHFGSFVPEYNNGAMDGFATSTYSKVPQSETQPVYWNMAQFDGVLMDYAWQSNSGPSFVAHQYLVAGQSGGWGLGGILDAIPTEATENGNNGDQTGGDAKGATCPPIGNNPSTVSQVNVTAPYPGDESITLQSHCRDYPSITDFLDTASVSWKYYTRSITQDGNIWAGVGSIRHVMAVDYSKMDASNNVLNDIKNGVLPSVAFVTPYKGNSDHPGQAKVAMNGPGWVSSVIDAVGNSPYWNSTQIFVTWDDWGGFFDHVTPPIISANENGFRVPLVAVGPYVKRVVVDHTPRNNYGAMLRFVESTFALPSLGTADIRADDMMGLCGTDSPTCPGIIDPTQTPVPFWNLPSFPFDTSP